MPILDLITVLCIGSLVGNELAVSLFVNPAIWKLDEAPQAKALSLLARSLGSVMPFWYNLSFLLLIAEAFVGRHGAHPYLLYAAVFLWIVATIYTLAFLVPINNRIARLVSDSLPFGWRSEHHRWDTLHRWRVLMLASSMACTVWAIVSR